MKKIFVLFILGIICFFETYGQTSRFQKYPIKQTGRFGYFPADPASLKPEKSLNGSDVYTIEISEGSNNYGTVFVDFAQKNKKEKSKDELEKLLITYLDLLKKQLNITQSFGYSKGRDLESIPDATVLLDLWEDASGVPWAIRGWVNNNSLEIMYINESPEPRKGLQSVFIAGL